MSAEFGLLALILLTGLILASPVLLLLALPLAVHITLGLLLASEISNPQLRRSLSAHHIHEGDGIEADLALDQAGQGPDLAMLTEDRWLARYISEGPPSLASRITANSSLVLSYVSRPRRGFYPVERAHISTRDLLGFITWKGDLPCSTPIWVLPRYDRVGHVQLSPRRTLSTPGTAPSRREGVGVQFLGTRPYIPGDDLRRINWKTLAHRNHFVINLYEGERAADVTVVLDARDRIYQAAGGSDLFDKAVRACAALCDSTIRDGHRTGLLLYGERLEWVIYGSGRLHLERILRGLSRAELGSSEAFADLGNLPARLFPTGSSIMIVSPFAPGDEQALGMLRARGYEVLALVPDPFPSIRAKQLEKVHLEARTLRSTHSKTELSLASRMMAVEQQLMLRILMSAGVRVALWDGNSPLAPLVRAAWGRSR